MAQRRVGGGRAQSGLEVEGRGLVLEDERVGEDDGGGDGSDVVREEGARGGTRRAVDGAVAVPGVGDSTASVAGNDDEEERKETSSLLRLPRGVTQIVLTGSLTSGHISMARGDFNRSVQYVQSITRLYERKGYKVHQRITGDRPAEIDEDVVFLSRATHFRCSHGTFSRAIAQIVDYRGGVVYPPETCLQRCTAKPRLNSSTFRTDLGFRGGRPNGSRM